MGGAEGVWGSAEVIFRKYYKLKIITILCNHGLFNL